MVSLTGLHKTATLVLGGIYQIHMDYTEEQTQPSIPTGQQQHTAPRSSAAPSGRNVTQPTWTEEQALREAAVSDLQVHTRV